jgi:hypothetical protein
MVGVKSAIPANAARYMAEPNIFRGTYNILFSGLFSGIVLTQFADGTHYAQVVTVQCLGEMGFSATSFWLSLLLQNVRKDSAIKIALELLPMVIGGIAVNVVCAFVLHKVSNQALMGVGTVAYTVAFLILSFMREEAPYWAYIFPSLILMVIGMDIQYNVTNVSLYRPAAHGGYSTRP